MAKARKKRKNYTAQQRSDILAAATRNHLTAAQVQRKFGVAPVTYYSWRKKLGVTRPRGGAVGHIAVRGADLNSQLRHEVANRVRRILPDIVRTEVNSYLNTLFAGGPGRKRGYKA